MKLELKHLAPYLPYGLIVKTDDQEREMVVCWSDIEHDINPHVSISTVLLKGYKPILRPLSDLTGDCVMDEHIIDKGVHSEICWEEWTYLFENHFDAFGLIPKGLAVDINTL